MLTAVIPTRNRENDLKKAVLSVLDQTRLPDELMIVDQSPGNESRVAIEAMFLGRISPRLVYIHDAGVTGLVDAKRVATLRAKGDIICFLEDDIVLEPEYLAQIEKGFQENPEILGCSGIVTNAPPQSKAYCFFYQLFHQGIYQDPRVGIYGFFKGHGHPLIRSNVLSGGLSAWRKEVFSKVDFDPSRGFFMMEDIDFSTRVVKVLGPYLFINPNARLKHYWSGVNREGLQERQRRKLVETVRFYQLRRDWPYAFLSFFWLLVGLFLETVIQSFKKCKLDVLRGYFSGIRDGFKN